MSDAAPDHGHSMFGRPMLGAADHGAVPPPQPVVQGGWHDAWQDASGQFHYPYGDAATATPTPHHLVSAPPHGASHAPVVDDHPAPFVSPRQLDEVVVPRFAAPARPVRDPRRATLAAVITFACLLIALWAILGFLSSLSSTLDGIASGSGTLELQLAEANAGLDRLEVQTGNLSTLREDSGTLKGRLANIDATMARMLVDVERIDVGMSSMDSSLATLDTELTAVNDTNAVLSADLANINRGLVSQRAKVTTMRRDGLATGAVLRSLPPRLRATNGRLGHINSVVNFMGCNGITNNIKVKIKVGPLTNGSATVFATVVPKGAWGRRLDGGPC